MVQKFIIHVTLSLQLVCTMFGAQNLFGAEQINESSNCKKIAIIGSATALVLVGAGVGGYFIHEAVNDENSLDSNWNPPTLRPTTNAPTASPAEGDFQVKLVNMGSNQLYDDAFEKAKARWESVIVNDLEDFKTEDEGVDDLFDGFFSTPYKEDVDDVVIGYSVSEIDGASNILGFAGPTYARGNIPAGDVRSAIAGIMVFDEVDFSNMSQEDREVVVLHEMGHVLGIGTFWRFKCGEDCRDFSDYDYTCTKAQEEYDKLGFVTDLKLENDGGGGTRCGHWDESSFFNADYSELMTGFFEANKYQPLSAVTAGALEDFGGYVVNYDATDLFPTSLEGDFELVSGLKPLKSSTTFTLQDRIIEPELKIVD